MTIAQNYQRLKSKIQELSYEDLINYQKEYIEFELNKLDFPISCISEITEYLWLFIQDQRNDLKNYDLSFKDDDDNIIFMLSLLKEISIEERHSILWNYKKILYSLKDYNIIIDDELTC